MKTTLLSLLLLSLSAPAFAEPLATAEGDVEGLRIEVTDLKRGTGDVVTLRFTIVNESKQKVVMDEFLIAHYKDRRTVSAVVLTDTVNKKKHLVIRDEEQIPLTSSKVADIEPGQKRTLWAKFPAPASETVSVIVPHFEPMDDVPVR